MPSGLSGIHTRNDTEMLTGARQVLPLSKEGWVGQDGGEVCGPLEYSLNKGSLLSGVLAQGLFSREMKLLFFW